MTQHTEHIYGVRYPDNREDWNVSVWFGSIDEPDGRHRFTEQYELGQKLVGADVGKLVFLHRKKVVSYSDIEEIDDPPYVEETEEAETSE